MRKIPLVILVFIPCISMFGQQIDSTQVDLIDLVIGKEKSLSNNQVRSKKKIHFSLLPSAVSTPGAGRAVITAVNATFSLGEKESTNLSNVYFVPFTDFSGRYGLIIRSNVWLKDNKWNLLGDYRVEHFPRNTWGLGGNSNDSAQSIIDTDYVRINQDILRNIGGNWFLGLGYALDHNYNIEETDVNTESNLAKYPITNDGTSISSGVTFNISYDARYNAINPPKGAYLLARLRLNHRDLGSDQNYQTLFIDARKYLPLGTQKVNILALRSYYWTLLGGTAPYLDLPSTNSTPTLGISSRGFKVGRYRSNAMLYGEAEHRYQLTENGLFGLVTFINISSASEFDTQQFKYWKPGAGIGLRTKFNKYSDTNIAIDFGFSEDFWSVWLNIGEVF